MVKHFAMIELFSADQHFQNDRKPLHGGTQSVIANFQQLIIFHHNQVFSVGVVVVVQLLLHLVKVGYMRIFNTNQKPCKNPQNLGICRTKFIQLGHSPDPFSCPNIEEEKAVWLRKTVVIASRIVCCMYLYCITIDSIFSVQRKYHLWLYQESIIMVVCTYIVCCICIVCCMHAFRFVVCTCICMVNSMTNRSHMFDLFHLSWCLSSHT